MTVSFFFCCLGSALYGKILLHKEQRLRGRVVIESRLWDAEGRGFKHGLGRPATESKRWRPGILRGYKVGESE